MKVSQGKNSLYAHPDLAQSASEGNRSCLKHATEQSSECSQGSERLTPTNVGDMYDSKEARTSDNEQDDSLGFRWRPNERQLFDRAAFLLFCRCFTCLTPWNFCIWFPHWLSYPEGTLWVKGPVLFLFLKGHFHLAKTICFPIGWWSHYYRLDWDIVTKFSVPLVVWKVGPGGVAPSDSCLLALSLGVLSFGAPPILIGKNIGMKRS